LIVWSIKLACVPPVTSINGIFSMPASTSFTCCPGTPKLSRNGNFLIQPVAAWVTWSRIVW
jgi:hypothetical protein